MLTTTDSRSATSCMSQIVRGHSWSSNLDPEHMLGPLHCMPCIHCRANAEACVIKGTQCRPPHPITLVIGTPKKYTPHVWQDKKKGAG